MEYARGLVGVVVSVLGLTVLGLLLAHTYTAGGALIVLFCAVFLMLSVVRGTRLFPLQDRRRPRIGQIEGGAGPVDAVLFCERYAMTWCWAGAWTLAATVFYVGYLHQAQVMHVSPVLVLTSPVGLAFLVFAGLCVWRARRARYFAVTSDALMLRHRRIRTHIPWDDIAEAWPITDMAVNLAGAYPRYVRFIGLIPRPQAVAPPGFSASFRRFGGMPFLSREIGNVPALKVDDLAAPQALLRAIRWHVTRPHTPGTLIDGYESDWADEDPHAHPEPGPAQR